MRTNRINLLLVVSILLTIASGIITHFAVRESGERVTIVLHTQKIIEQSAELVNFIKDTEATYRNLLIGADEANLRLLDSAGNVALQRLAQLHVLVSDSLQIDMLENTISPLIVQKLDDLKKSAHARQSSLQGVARIDDLLYKTAQLDTIQLHLKHFNQREQQLLHARLDTLQRTLVAQRKIRYISLILIAITSCLALIALIKKEKLNTALIEALNVTNNTLELKVKERTQELEKKSILAEKLNRDLNENFHTLELFYKALQIKKTKAEDTIREIEFLYDRATCGYHSLSGDGVIISINKTELNWLGYTRDEVVNNFKMTDILIPDEGHIFHQKFKEFIKVGVLKNMKFHLKRKDGTVFPVLLNSTALYNEFGDFVMSRATVVDITEQEENAKKLIDANHKLLTLNEEKNNFLGMAAHDLKSPLNGILGLINLINTQATNLTTQQQEYLRYIENACTSMKVMVTNLLDINRIEQGLNAIEPAPFRLITVLENQIKIAKEHARKKGIRIILGNNNSDIVLISDEAGFARIVDNLLSNAIKFSPPGKQVWITATAREDHVAIDFIDQGPGIRSDEMDQLFSKFKKLSNRPTAGESSTGLGLSIVRELTTLLKGKIHVTSQPSKGSTFTVELPYSIILEDKIEFIKN